MAYVFQLNSGMRCVKNMLLIISFMFAITSVLLIMVGSTIKNIFGDFEQFIDDHFFSPPSLLIAIGFIMLFVSTLGAFGAFKESVLLINLYGILLFTVFILEVAAAFSAFLLQTNVHYMLVRTMNESLQSYETNEYLRAGVDFMQSELKCCGVIDSNDWRSVLNDNKNLTEIDPTVVPASCCPNAIGNVCEEVSQFVKSGCLNRMNFLISQSVILIAAGATIVALIQLLGSVCAFMLAKTLRRNKSIREARRWQLQQSLGILVSEGSGVFVSEGYAQLEKFEKQKVFQHPEQEPVTYTANSSSVI